MKFAQCSVRAVHHGFAHVVDVFHGGRVAVDRAVCVEHVGEN